MAKQSKRQPAKKSYYFGQGYKDIGLAVKESWQANKRTAKKHYDKYKEKGIMSFIGMGHFLCSLSVVTFGTFFFAVITTVLLVLSFIRFVFVYMCFPPVWLLDHAYLMTKKIFTTCTECKRKFLIPTYVCPGCKVQHTNLTPGVYGIFRRTCNCGESLPSTFFNGRKKMQALCPHCVKEARYTQLFNRESRPLCIPVIGGRSVGKTAYITAFSKQFIDVVAPRNDLAIELYNEQTKKIYSEINTDFEQGSTRMTVRTHDLLKASTISFSFFVKNSRLKPERLVHIYDIAGEVFTDNSENEIQLQYSYCHGVVFVVDPFSLPLVRAKYEDGMTIQDKAGIGKADTRDIMDVFFNKLREVTGMASNEISKIPVAIIIGKIDSAGLADVFSNEEVKKYAESCNCNESKAVDLLCRNFFVENGLESFVRAVELNFRHNQFFAVSAIGHSRDEGKYRPIGVLKPIEWICSISDKEFAALWAGK